MSPLQISGIHTCTEEKIKTFSWRRQAKFILNELKQVQANLYIGWVRCGNLAEYLLVVITKGQTRRFIKSVRNYAMNLQWIPSYSILNKQTWIHMNTFGNIHSKYLLLWMPSINHNNSNGQDAFFSKLFIYSICAGPRARTNLGKMIFHSHFIILEFILKLLKQISGGTRMK